MKTKAIEPQKNAKSKKQDLYFHAISAFFCG